MNKYLIFIFSTIVACKNSKTELNTYEENSPVIIRLSKKHKKMSRINIPIGVTIKNKSILKQSFISLEYEYTPYQEGIGEDIYMSDGTNKLTAVVNDRKKTINSYSSNKYIIYSWYRLDSLQLIQQQFRPYIEKMLTENKDTLHIGTVSEFKQKHKTLFEQLTKGDSISIQFLDGKKLGERITVPVEW